MDRVLNLFTACLGGQENKSNTENERSHLLISKNEKGVPAGQLGGLQALPKSMSSTFGGHPIIPGENFEGFSDFDPSEDEFSGSEPEGYASSDDYDDDDCDSGTKGTPNADNLFRGRVGRFCSGEFNEYELNTDSSFDDGDFVGRACH